MSVARIRHFLQATGRRLARHQRAVATATIVLGGAALVPGFSFAGLSGLAVVVALLASIGAGVLWLRLRVTERSYAALVVSLAELTARLDRVEASSLIALAESGSAPSGFGVSSASSDVPVTSVPAATSSDTSFEPMVPDGDSVTVGIGHGQMPDAAVATEVVSTLLPEAVIDPSEQDHQSAGPDDGHLDPDQSTPSASAPVVGTGQDEETDDDAVAAIDDDLHAVGPGDAAVAIVPERMPGFALTSLKGDTVTDADLAGRPSVVVFWRSGCDHSRRLTPELVAWESLQGPRLVVFAACDGPTAFRAGLPGMVILDPAFSVGQALGAPGTPAALPIDADGRPSGPVVTGGSAVTTLLLDAMRDWASAEPEPIADEPTTGLADDSNEEITAGEPGGQVHRRPTVLLRRVEEATSIDADAAPDWDADPATRRVG